MSGRTSIQLSLRRIEKVEARRRAPGPGGRRPRDEADDVGTAAGWPKPTEVGPVAEHGPAAVVLAPVPVLILALVPVPVAVLALAQAPALVQVLGLGLVLALALVLTLILVRVPTLVLALALLVLVLVSDPANMQGNMLAQPMPWRPGAEMMRHGPVMLLPASQSPICYGSD